MDKKKLFTILYVVLIFVVIATCVGLYIWLTTESAACLKDPIQFFSEQTNQICYCNSGNGWANP